MKRLTLLFFDLLLLVFAAQSCKTQYIPIPVKEYVYIHKTDSIYVKPDTVKYPLPPERVRDWTGLLDTLHLQTSLAEMSAYVDTTKAILAGEIKNKKKDLDVPVQEKHKIEYRDSIFTKEIPVEVEVEKIVKVVPRFWRFFGVTGIIAVVAALTYAVLKLIAFLKKKGIL